MYEYQGHPLPLYQEAGFGVEVCLFFPPLILRIQFKLHELSLTLNVGVSSGKQVLILVFKYSHRKQKRVIGPTIFLQYQYIYSPSFDISLLNKK